MFVPVTLQNGERLYLNTMHIEAFGTVTEKTFPGCGDSAGLTYIVTDSMNGTSKPYIVKESLGDMVFRTGGR